MVHFKFQVGDILKDVGYSKSTYFIFITKIDEYYYYYSTSRSKEGNYFEFKGKKLKMEEWNEIYTSILRIET